MRTIPIITARERTESKVICRQHVFSAVLAPMREQLLAGGGIVFTDSNVVRLYHGGGRGK